MQLQVHCHCHGHCFDARCIIKSRRATSIRDIKQQSPGTSTDFLLASKLVMGQSPVPDRRPPDPYFKGTETEKWKPVNRLKKADGREKKFGKFWKMFCCFLEKRDFLKKISIFFSKKGDLLKNFQFFFRKNETFKKI